MILHDLERSGNCYKIRLFLSILGLPYERKAVNLHAEDNHRPEFLALNPRGQIPVLEDRGTAIWDSTAILVYLARTYTDNSWLPLDALPMARAMQWLALEQNEGRYGLARSRAMALKSPSTFARTGNTEQSHALAVTGLRLLDGQLQRSAWLVAEREHPTIADLACYPYAALAPEGGIDLTPFTAVNDWIRRIAALPGYTALPEAPG